MNQLHVRIVEVPVSFRGVVRVSVSGQLADDDARLLAEHLALSRVLATTENADAPDDQAFDDYHDACSSPAAASSEDDWDDARVEEPTGEWSVIESVVEERRSSLQSAAGTEARRSGSAERQAS